jgi:hypothetical protein
MISGRRNDAPALGAGSVDPGAQRLAFCAANDHRGRSAAGAAWVSKPSAMRDRRRHRLVEVAMRVDAARRDDAACRVDLAHAGSQPDNELRLPLMPMSASKVSLPSPPGVAHHQVETAHGWPRRRDGVGLVHFHDNFVHGFRFARNADFNLACTGCAG